MAFVLDWLSEADTAGMAEEKKVSQFLNVLGKVEQQDSVWTSEKQIERLLRPGAKYRNLNPFEVRALRA